MSESQPTSIQSDGFQCLQLVEKGWTPEVELKPYVGQVFPSYDEAMAFYREYARNSGFEIRKATTQQSKKGDGYSRRRLTYHHKQLVHDVSDINIGPVRAFKILKQTQGGFVNVGATEVECKNLKRDMITYIGESDADMLGSHMSKTGVLKSLNSLIWNERISASDFDIEWQSIMDEYDLNSNNWFNEMFAIPDKWIPAYFQDCHLLGLMRTTSRSEGENYFYGLMTNADLHLIEFVSHFETAMEAQRFVQRKNNHDSRYTNPEIITKLLI
ncbi:unnamed protein product [Lactuca virosa]|uniref:Protein FAR1-RELATED SEQUENCE n=1 Tax=Lactuca virosa TaxID=75947 RepID=A0AAU9N725_9ASTR|nr:unnamed protein product [Lactuca virosa]